MNIVSPSMRRPFTVLVLVAAIVLGSLLALRETPRDIFPTLGIPTIYVAQPYGGMDAALNMVRPLFATLPGVSAPPPFGGSARSIVVNIKPDRLRSYNLSPDDIVAAISAANLITPSGNMPIKGKYPMVPLNSVARNIKDLESVPLRTGSYPTVFLRDVGDVTDASDIVTI